MVEQGVVGIRGVDTRSLVRHLRNHGSIAAGIFSGADAEAPREELVDKVRSQPAMAGADLAREVSTDEVYEVPAEGEERFTVVAYDMGIKSNTPRHLARRGMHTVVVPANTPYKDIEKYHADGVFISNGPGDPATADEMVEVTRDVIRAHVPLLSLIHI